MKKKCLLVPGLTKLVHAQRGSWAVRDKSGKEGAPKSDRVREDDMSPARTRRQSRRGSIY